MYASLLLSLALSAVAVPLKGKALHEKRDFSPKGWNVLGEAAPSVKMPMRIGLTQSNLHVGHDMLMEVSSHDSPKFGKHYTVEEVNDIFAPAKASVDAVIEWLQSEGIHEVSQSVNKQWLQFEADVETANELFATRFHMFEHSSTGTRNVACDEYHIPSHLREHVDYITPGIKLFVSPNAQLKETSDVEKRDFLNLRRKHKRPPPTKPMPAPIESILQMAFSAQCDIAITPECIATLYNITEDRDRSVPIDGNQLGIFEDLGDYYDQTDLNEFFATFAPYIPSGTHPVLDSIDGAVAPTQNLLQAGPESDLDFQISYPIIWPQNSVLFQTDDPVIEANYTYEGFLNNFLDAIDGSYCSYSAFGEKGNSPLDPPYPDPAPGGYKGKLQCGVYKPTNVISISYGGQEADLPASYQQRQCNEFMKLGMQGISVFVSSGDSGVSGPPDDDNPDGCLGPTGKIFSPDFPATCPYVTAVGATFLPPGANVYTDAETAVSRFPSGGGFSNIYPIPKYQAGAVAEYFKIDNPPYPYYSSVNNNSFGAHGGVYNRLGRGYPDVSAIGDNVAIYNAGEPVLIGGTSASSPTFAAIITRVNEARLAAKKSTVGFVNPVLYANPNVLHDITVGSNPGCGTNGFSVSKGWDPVTGLGTPNYPAILKLYLSLP